MLGLPGDWVRDVEFGQRAVIVSVALRRHRDESETSAHDGVQRRAQQQRDGAVAGAVPQSKWRTPVGHGRTVACDIDRRRREGPACDRTRLHAATDPQQVVSAASGPPLEPRDRLDALGRLSSWQLAAHGMIRCRMVATKPSA
jgi:hypothetical protein